METQHLHTVAQGKTSIRKRHSVKTQKMHVRRVALLVTVVKEDADKITRTCKLTDYDLFYMSVMMQYSVNVVSRSLRCLIMTGDERDIRIELVTHEQYSWNGMNCSSVCLVS